ncbi:hypothetical protein O181_037287 [Austropuccinia psidii MF-1]|uniref:Uncharacterized protein n=1 Tax=Austropuccinia psidii MF-1 TaxID=1389203 RepID=A0A9Q3D8P8_9BASI|nr:hypothetical protein [Austropuccinia psidii MF-1]
MDTNPPILAKNPQGPPVASGKPQRPPAQIRSTLPLNSRGRFLIPPWMPYSRIQEWCIYGIIYHYAPFLLSTPMVTVSGPNSMIPNQGPKIHHQFQRRTLQLIRLAIHGGYQKTVPGPQPPGPQELGWQFFQDYSKGHSKRLFTIQSVFKAESTSILLGQLNWSIQAAINQPVCSWPNWANSYSTVGIQSHSSIFKMARAVLAQLRQYSR